MSTPPFPHNQPHYSGQAPVPPPAPPRRRKSGRTALIVLGVFVLLAVIARLAGGSDPASSTASSSGSVGTSSGAAQHSEALAGIGTEVRDGDFAFIVTGVTPGVKQLGKGSWSTRAQGEFVLVKVTVTNIGKDSTMFSGGNQKLRDAQGREFDADSGSAVMYLPDSESFLNQINPGNSVNATVVFDVPAGLQPTAIELHDSMFSRGVTVSLA